MSANSQVNGALDRWRSFAERYVVARAAHFTKGEELQDGWQAIHDAKKIYGLIAQVESPDAQPADGIAKGMIVGTAKGTIHGVPVHTVIRDMRQAGLPPAVIHTYLSDAIAGKVVPPHEMLCNTMSESVLKHAKGSKV